jgi:hypothetical protein
VDPRKKLFIGSSNRAATLAEALKELLSADMDVTHWKEERVCNGTIFDKLVRSCREVDFAAFLLTADDFKQTRGNRLAVPRDNCIFELGLFMGALGLAVDRCYMITSLREASLPGDLKGYIYIQIQEPPELESLEACKDAINGVAGQLRNSTSKLPIFARPVVPVLTVENVMERERRRKDGGRLFPYEEVMVHAPKPMEVDNGLFADRVRANMKAGIEYKYFFSTQTLGCVNKIASMIKSLVAVDLPFGKEWEERDVDDYDRQFADPENEPLIGANLRALGSYLSIHFVPHPASETFCVHNAVDLDQASCYLRLGDNFIEYTGSLADKVGAYNHFAHDCSAVFGGTKYVTKIQLMEMGLTKAIERRFPSEWQQAVVSTCFGKSRGLRRVVQGRGRKSMGRAGTPELQGGQAVAPMRPGRQEA